MRSPHSLPGNPGAGLNRRQALRRLAALLAAPATTRIAPAATAPDRGLSAWWPFDKAAPGASAAPHAPAHNLTLKQVEIVPGAIGDCLRFSGKPGFQASTPQTPDLAPTREVTVSCWVRPAVARPNAEGIGLVYAPNAYLVRISGGMRPSFHIFTRNWGPVMAPEAIRAGEWYQVTGVYDGHWMSLFINGRLAARRPRSGAIHHSPGPLVLGRQVNRLAGDLDEVRIYARALDEDEVRRLFTFDRQRLRPGIVPGSLVEPFEELFGRTRGRPAPPVSEALLPPADFSFAFFTDTHIGVRGEESRYCHNDRVKAMLEQVNRSDAEFAINGGDMITTFPGRDPFPGQCRHAVALHKSLRIPVHFVPGNHDIGDQAPMQVFRPGEDARRAVKPEFIRTYRRFFGRDYYAFRRRDCHFTIIDSSLFNSGLPEEQEQWRFLEKTLAAAADARLRFAFMHNPPFWRAPDEPAEGNYEPVYPPARRRLLELLVKHHVAALFCGHTHFPFANRYKSLEIVTFNSPTFNRDFPDDGTGLPGAAEIYDPFKLGWALVRVKDGRWHALWTPTFERPPALPAAVRRGLLGPRPAAGTPPEKTASLNPVVPLPHTVFRQTRDRSGRRRTFSTAYDILWHTAEAMGSRWALVRTDWSAESAVRVRETLAVRPLERAAPVWPIPAAPAPRARALDVLAHSGISEPTVLVLGANAAEDGRPAATAAPAESATAQAVEACRAVRRALPGAHIVLGRFRLPRERAGLQRLEALFPALRAAGATRVSLWAPIQNAPEERLLPALPRLAAAARDSGLGLWLESSGLQRLRDPLRTARFLRLLALAFQAEVPVFWWGGLRNAAGFHDRHLDPTPLLRAGAAWNEITRDGPAPAALEHRRGIFTCEWRAADGKRRRAWWRTDETMAAARSVPLPPWTGAALDLVANRFFRNRRGKIAIMPWPRVAVET